MGKYTVTKGIQFGKGIKTLIYGVEGVGKSTLASKFPKAVFLDTEGSTDKYNFVERYPTPTSIAMLNVTTLQQVVSIKQSSSIHSTRLSR